MDGLFCQKIRPGTISSETIVIFFEVDINFLVGAGEKLRAPVLRDVNRLGLSAISKSVWLPLLSYLIHSGVLILH